MGRMNVLRQFNFQVLVLINLDLGLTEFNMYPYQKTMAKMICDSRFNIIKTCRQAGKTTTSAAVILWHLIFQEEYTIL